MATKETHGADHQIAGALRRRGDRDGLESRQSSSRRRRAGRSGRSQLDQPLQRHQACARQSAVAPGAAPGDKVMPKLVTGTKEARRLIRMERGETRYTAEFRTEIGHTFTRHWPTL